MVKFVQFHSIEDVKDFVTKTSRCDFEVDLVSGRYRIDAKSIMGIFSLDLGSPMELRIRTDECDDYLASIQPYLTK